MKDLIGMTTLYSGKATRNGFELTGTLYDNPAFSSTFSHLSNLFDISN